MAGNTTMATPFYRISELKSSIGEFVIQARVIKKRRKEYCKTAKFEGFVADCVLSDRSGEIKVKAFQACAVSLDEILQFDQVYTFSGYGANLKKVDAGDMYNTLGHEFELMWDKKVRVAGPFPDSTVGPTYKFVPIDQIFISAEAGQTRDVCAWVENPGVCEETENKDGKLIRRRTVTLADESERTIQLTLWKEEAENFYDGPRHPLLVIKGAVVGHYGGTKMLSINYTSAFKVVQGWMNRVRESHNNNADLANQFGQLALQE
jgi:hypothetical protein